MSSSSSARKLTPCEALTFVLLLVAPACLSSLQSAQASWASAWDPYSEGLLGRPARTRRQLHFRNEWASWSGWSVCSRTCGTGAAVRTRTCITRNPLGGPCGGDPRQYKICNTKECPPGSQEFREMQCAAFNEKQLVTGNSFRWTTFQGGSNPCELNCLALGHNFYYNFGRVLDGTACDKVPGAVCVNGRCLEQEDACMVCGGKNTTCLHHRSVYQSNGLEAGPFGYNEVTKIPAGATHIRVTDNSRNYLALQNGHSQFVINGNWKISVPGEYNIAGTKLLYRRSADTWESFEVPGPTREDLRLMVLATDRNPGIEYEYWLPPDQYDLHHGKRSPLRQAHHSANYLPWTVPIIETTTTTTTTTTRPPPVSTRPHWFVRPLKPPRHPSRHPILPRLERDENHRNLLPQPSPGRYCGKCRRVKGRRERQRQYCQKDFIFRARVLGKLYRGEETRYDVQILHTYRNSFRLEHREFLWVPNVCDCPNLEQGKQYILMVRRHINYEHTLNRILLEEDSYVVPYRPREDELVRQLEWLCNKRGPQYPAA
ncbi:ADAMTS-like protein 5 isoform X2 [Hippocampus zosterae]|uniref:ADAMTS-like protein 5 isoform X2 n=1 Tax=Hippocampus zosterae TaxID=109293 RepID=UPI00223D6557|nr:ADAMTS-like protein 5 isoform X2 [Hippocampus zosterae]